MIVHATDFFAPRIGGIETQVAGLASAQAASGRQVRVVTTTASVPPDSWSFEVHRIADRAALPVRPLARRLIWRALDELDPQLVHAHLSVVSPCAWYAIGWALRRGRPVVASVHSLWGGPARALHRALDLPGGWLGRTVLAAVSEAAAVAVRRAVPAAEVAVVPNGIDLRLWRGPARPLRTGGVHVVAVGRLAGRRRPLALLEVLRAARARVGPGLRATIAGSGPAQPRLAAYLRRHRMDRWVRLAGHLDRTGVRDLLHEADVYLNVALRESFGIAALEARTAGVPVVALASTGTSDFVRHEREGLLCHGLDGLADGLVRLATDHRLRHVIAAYNRDHGPTECAWPSTLAAFERCYTRAADRLRPEIRTF